MTTERFIKIARPLFYMTERIDYNYHVFGLAQGDREGIEKYVADGPSNIVNVPIILHGLDNLAGEICEAHMDYLEDQVDKKFLSNDRLQYIGISFEPKCNNVIHDGQIYRTQRLSENEQQSLLEHLSKHFD